ncbi:hypothetical protein ACUN0C_12395 [Faunimonas sp. B44]|uniref:hypothetical protein n=1 Tax=Faunimonas sp. B44 TaxID=3461493 RepID=UPI004043C8DC
MKRTFTDGHEREHWIARLFSWGSVVFSNCCRPRPEKGGPEEPPFVRPDHAARG